VITIIRQANEKDIPKIREIHNQGIIDRIATLDEKIHSEVSQKIWFKNHKFPFGIWVIERGKKVIGWVSLNVFNSRPAYRFVADLSVYVDKYFRGKGFGSLLIDFAIKKVKKTAFIN